MSKTSDYVCPPCDIAAIEQKANEYRKGLSHLGVTDPVFFVVENLSGQQLKLKDQRCESGKWVYGPSVFLRDGQALVLMVGQPKMSLSGVAACVVLSNDEGLAVSCCFENTVMRDYKIMGGIGETEERIAEDVFAQSLALPAASSSNGTATYSQWVLDWKGDKETKIFSIYQTNQIEKLAKWREIHRQEEPSSPFAASAGTVLRTVDVKEQRLYQFLEVTLQSTLDELQYTEGEEEISETVHGYMQRSLDESFELVWSFADADGGGTLDEDECERFATDFFGIFIHEAPAITGELLKKQNKNPVKYQIRVVDDAIARIKEVTSGFSVKQLSHDLFNNMWNVEGEVKKEDFRNCFIPLMNRLMQPIKVALIESKVKEEAIEQEMENETGVKKQKPQRPWAESLQKRLRCECF